MPLDGWPEPFADEELPRGAAVSLACAVDGRELARDAIFDVVVVGSGAAGAVAADRLAAAGLSVALVEEGPFVRTRDLTPDLLGAFATLFRDGGMQAIEGRAFIPLLQGRCVGGSTVINSAIAWRAPADVFADWSSRFQLPPLEAVLASHYDALEAELGVATVSDEALGENNGRFLDLGAVAGAQRMRRYAPHCEGRGQCLTGCPAGRKQSMSLTFVPRALRRGARLFHDAEVTEVVFRERRAVGVRLRGTSAAPTAPVTLHARRAVVLAASTVQTPAILRRSGVRGPHLGAHFQAHPGLAMLARFDEPIDMAFGATQGAESVAYRGEGFKIETISMPPGMLMARMPTVGASSLEQLRHVAMWSVQIRADAEGSVGRSLLGRERVTYAPSRRDMEVARRALGVLARLFFEAGAREVWPGVHGVSSRLTSGDAARCLDDGPLDPRAYSFIATHLFGAARMAKSARAGVVDLDFAVHDREGLYVVDSSVFPTNLGVNPQHTIMAMASLAATRLAERLTSAAARPA